MTEPVQHESRVRLDRKEGRAAERIALVGLALILVAIVKPWGGPAAAPSAVAPPPDRQPVAVEPTPAGPVVDPACSSGRWPIEADERWAGQVVRTWLLTDAVTADGPADPRIRFVVVAAQQVVSLGYCPPYDDDVRPNDALSIYRLSPLPIVVPTVPIRMSHEANADANLLFRPAAPAGASSPSGASSAPGPGSSLPAGPPTWPAGRYVLLVE